MKYSDSKTSPEAFQFVCEPKRVAYLISLASASGSTSSKQVFSICSFYNQALERFRDSKQGLSTRSKILLGAVLPVANTVGGTASVGDGGLPYLSRPAITLVWDQLLRSKASEIEKASESVINFTSLATNLLLDTLDDEEIFSKQLYFTIEDLIKMIFFMKSTLYELIWLKQLKPSDGILQFVNKLYDRTSRHEAQFKQELWLFPSIPLNELGLGSISTSTSSSSFERRSGRTSTSMEEEQEEEEEVDLSALLQSTTARGQMILKLCPMCVAFDLRVSLFHRLLTRYKTDNTPNQQPTWNEVTQQIEHPYRLRVKLQRNSIVEDAYEQLFASSTNLKNLRLQISFVNEMGLDETLPGGATRAETPATSPPKRAQPAFTPRSPRHPNPSICAP